MKLHECTDCGKRFSQRDVLQIHLLTHAGDKPHKCTQCEARYADPSVLMIHMRTHTGDRPHKCVLCNATFMRSSQLAEHVCAQPEEKAHACSVCGSSFARPNQLKKHMLTHAEPKPRAHMEADKCQCPRCGAQFSYPSELSSHVCSFPGQAALYDSPLAHHNMPAYPNTSRCGVPGFPLIGAFVTPSVEQQQQQQPSPSAESLMFRRSGRLTSPDSSQQYECQDGYPGMTPTPGSWNLAKPDLFKPLPMHPGDKPHSSKQPDSDPHKNYSRDLSLSGRSNSNSNKLKERPFQCSECESTFTRRDHLTRHLGVHTGYKPHKCPECDACFVTNYYLSRHMWHHTGIKPYKCEVCNASFGRKYHLTRHSRSHGIDKV